MKMLLMLLPKLVLMITLMLIVSTQVTRGKAHLPRNLILKSQLASNHSKWVFLLLTSLSIKRIMSTVKTIIIIMATIKMKVDVNMVVKEIRQMPKT